MTENSSWRKASREGEGGTREKHAMACARHSTLASRVLSITYKPVNIATGPILRSPKFESSWNLLHARIERNARLMCSLYAPLIQPHVLIMP